MSDSVREAVAARAAVKRAIQNQQWDLAREICQPEWAELCEQIDRAEQSFLAASGAEPVMAIGDFELRLDAEVDFDTAIDTAQDERGPGTYRSYFVTGPGETLLHLESFEATDGTQWVICADALHSAPEFQRLTSGLRLQSQPTGATGRSFMVGMAKFSESAKRGSSIKKARPDELDAMVDGRIAHLLVDAGASHFGTREDLLRDASPKKNFLCVIDKAGTHSDLAPIIYSLTRVLPIARHLGLR